MNQSPLRVAFVDDDDDLRAMVALSLRLSHGCDTHTCASGHQALRELPAFHPDVIMLDYMMPALNGFQTLDALAAVMDLRDIKVVITSAAGIPEEQCQQRGATTVLPKPFDALQLGQWLEDLCAG